MPAPNKLNTENGRLFQEKAARLLGDSFATAFLLDHPIPVGDPSKSHRFDLSSRDLSFVGKCKNCSWTEGRNVPSAKMSFLDEAAYYLSLVPPATTRFMVLRKDTCEGRIETLADYYVRMNGHLLKGGLVLDRHGLRRREAASAEVSSGHSFAELR